MIGWFSKKPEPKKTKKPEKKPAAKQEGPSGPPMPRGKQKPKRVMTEERAENIEKIKKVVENTASPQRDELIRQAMRIRKTKMKVLEDLGDEDKLKLYAMALKAMMGKDLDGGGKR